MSGLIEVQRKPSATARALRVVIAGVQLLVALQIVVALVPWFEQTDPRVLLGPVRPALYFTVQSNALCAVVLVLWAVALLRGRHASRATEYVRGLATVDAAITGIVYGALLGGGGEALLHLVVPLFMAIWWIVLPPHPPVAWFAVAIWLVHPLLWIGAVLALRQASADHWVPYYFLDPAVAGGWPAVGVYLAAIVAAIAALGALAVAANRFVPWRSLSWRPLQLGRPAP